MNSEKYSNNSWPTPAMKTYERTVCEAFAKYFWKQDGANRKTLLSSVASELFHEGGRRIYKRMPDNGDVLVRQTLPEFEGTIVQKRLDNLRYPTGNVPVIYFMDTHLILSRKGNKF